MINRGFIYILATLIAGLTSFRAFAEEPEFDPEKIARNFMATVGAIQAETSIQELKEYKNTLVDVADRMAEILLEKKTEVESIRNKLKDLDDAIQTSHIRLVMALGSGNTDEQEALLKILETRRKELVSEEKIAYKAYANYRGRTVVIKIIFKLLLNEIAKRIVQLGGNNTDSGNTVSGIWSATYTADDGTTTPQGGDFSLVIGANGIISGIYHDGGAGISVSGTRDPVSGVCQGVGSDPSSPATWSGTIKQVPGGYTGSGSLSFKPKAGGFGAGAWSTK